MEINEIIKFIGYTTILNNAIWWLWTFIALVKNGHQTFYEWNILISFPEMLIQIFSLFFTLYLVIDYILSHNPRLLKKLEAIEYVRKRI